MAFVQMETNEQATRSIEALHGTMVRSQDPYHDAAAVHAGPGDVACLAHGPGRLQAAPTGVHPLLGPEYTGPGRMFLSLGVWRTEWRGHQAAACGARTEQAGPPAQGAPGVQGPRHEWGRRL